jgi:hypothetical protein
MKRRKEDINIRKREREIMIGRKEEAIPASPVVRKPTELSRLMI